VWLVAKRFLRIYMNDQLAAGVLWREVARRAQRNNAGTALGEALARVAEAIGEDVVTFDQMMRRLGFRPSRLKPIIAIASERLGRLKLNGRIVRYSRLSRFEELDFLVMGIEGKKILWANLRDFAQLAKRLPGIDFDHLIERAQSQRDELEAFRAAAGTDAFRSEAATEIPFRA
jgi:hypothetical protein